MTSLTEQRPVEVTEHRDATALFPEALARRRRLRRTIAIALVAAFSRHRLGGYTGDVLGAAGVVGETIGLLILATR